MSYDLSILIPAGIGELWTRRTIEDILAHSGERTEIIVGCDGDWPPDGIPAHPRVSVLYGPEQIGQRAITNELARISQAKWVMKCDAHVSFSHGFDEVLMKAMEGHDDWTIVPKMYNLQVFDRVCWECGHHDEQGPIEVDRDGNKVVCKKCGGGPLIREVTWVPKKSPETTAMRFSRELRFDYWSGYKQRQVWDENGCAETLSLLGACWMLTRERYFELDICDEKHGSWGQQGTEVACKTWLSGGKLMCCRDCWFAHMFRTQGGDFGFPWNYSGRQVDHAREYSKRLWLGDNWPLAKHSLAWLLARFAPVPEWSVNKGIVFYTDNRAPTKIAKRVQGEIKKVGLPIVSVSLKPMPHLGRNIHIEAERGIETMFRQILAGLEASREDYVFFCEHDVLYHPTHFAFVPERDDLVYYNVNVWKVRLEDGLAVKVDDCRQTSGLCANRELLVEHYRKRVELVEKNGFSRTMGFEPGTHGRSARVDDLRSGIWRSEFPNVDLRHGQNLTASRWSPEEFRNKRFAKGWTELPADEIPGWNGTLSSLVTGRT